jgi:hypothetical protein
MTIDKNKYNVFRDELIKVKNELHPEDDMISIDLIDNVWKLISSQQSIITRKQIDGITAKDSLVKAVSELIIKNINTNNQESEDGN